MRAAIILMLVAACYGAPDYSATAFKCDAQHACPDGQQCIAGVCKGGSGNGDASTGGPDGVKCGAGLVCPVGQQCCADQVHPFRCIAATDSCPGLAATCDGVEDCMTGQRCCDTGATAQCGPATCNSVACTDNTDCPGDQPECCFIDNSMPWGQCEFQC